MSSCCLPTSSHPSAASSSTPCSPAGTGTPAASRHAVVDTVALRGATNTDDELLATLKRIRAAHDRFIDEPVEPLPKTSCVGARRNDGRVQRTRYELCLWFLARDALRAGRLYRPIGRRYADAAGFLMPADRGAATWPAAPSAAGSRSAWIAATTIASSPSVQAMRNGARAIRASSTQNVVGSCETRPRG
jgi:hypothetical protein